MYVDMLIVSFVVEVLSYNFECISCYFLLCGNVLTMSGQRAMSQVRRQSPNLKVTS